MYAKGRGVPQDYAEAAKWFHKGAEKGSGSAQVKLGAAYVLGRGVPQDYVVAHMWFNLAAAQGEKFAAKARDGIAKKMTPADVSKAQRMAKEWLAKHGKAD